jgi:hypothetical protein
MDTINEIVNQQLLVSAANGDTKEVIKAIQTGADLNAQDANGFTPLHCAVYNNYLDVVRILVNSGANINVKDVKIHEGWTPVHYASARGRLDILKALLQSSQDPHILNQSNQTPTDLAATREIEVFLVEDQLRRNHQGESAPLVSSPTQRSPRIATPIIHSVPSSRKEKVVRFFCVFLFLLFPVLWLLINPHVYPWFIIPDLLILFLVSLVKIKENRGLLQSLELYGLTIHFSLFVCFNSILIISNIWSGKFPYSFCFLSFGVLLLMFHAFRYKYKESEWATIFSKHFVMYCVICFNLFVSWRFVVCTPGGGCDEFDPHRSWAGILLIPIPIWTIIIIVHYTKHKRAQRVDGELYTYGLPQQFSPQYHQQEVQQNFTQFIPQMQLQSPIAYQVERSDCDPQPNIHMMYPQTYQTIN